MTSGAHFFGQSDELNPEWNRRESQKSSWDEDDGDADRASLFEQISCA
jgi:hypothetical protein